jgi:hypothetical protein
MTTRTEFLTDLLVTAIENCGYGWFEVDEYDPDQGTATITDSHTGLEYKVNLSTMSKGLGVIREATLGPATDHNGFPVQTNRETGDRLYFGGPPRTDLLICDQTNGEDGEYDVIGALAVLECGLFGQVVYA